MSGDMCNFFSLFFFEKVVDPVGGGSVINRAFPAELLLEDLFITIIKKKKNQEIPCHIANIRVSKHGRGVDYF